MQLISILFVVFIRVRAARNDIQTFSQLLVNLFLCVAVYNQYFHVVVDELTRVANINSCFCNTKSPITSIIFQSKTG